MKTIYQKTDIFAERFAIWVLRYRWPVLILMLILCAAFASGMRHLSISNDYRVFFSKENPDLTAFEFFQSEYTKNDNILFVIKPASGGIFTPQIAAAVEELTEKAWTIPYVLRVDSVSNFQHSQAEDDDILVDRLYRNAGSMTPEQLREKEAIALAEPLLKNNLISADGTTTGINVTLQYPGESIAEVPATAASAREIRDQLLAKYPDITIAISGIAMLNNAFAEASQQDMGTLIPLMYLIIIVVLALSLRSLAASMVTLLVITLSIVAAMGFAGFSRIGLTPISFTAPTIIMTLAISDSIHILVSIISSMREGKSKHDSIIESIRVNFVAVCITSLTTVIGFLSLNFSDSPPFWHLGNITAFGIVVAWLLALLFLPAAISLLPLKVKATANQTSWLQTRLDGLALWLIRHSRKVLVGVCATSLVLIMQIPRLELNDDFVRYFAKDIQFRTDSEFVIDNLNGIYLVEYSLGATGPSAVSEPEYLQNLEKFTVWLRQQPEVRHVFSYTDIIKRLNMNMHGDDPAQYRLPDDRMMAAQLLFLYENSLPAGTNLSDRVTTDKSATRITATIDDMTAKEGIAFFQRSEQWLQQNTPAYMWTKPTSVSVMFSYISQRNIESMLKGNAMALVLIALVLMLALRSVGMGALSLIPNMLPILVMYGIWSVLVGKIGMAAATVSATSLGIVVDDTVHFLTKYLRARRESGMEPPDAIRYAFRTVGPAIVLTTVVLGLGFSALAFSSFLINSQMGLLTTVSIVVALILDLLLLPALLLIRYKKMEIKAYEPAFSSQAS